MPRPRYHLATSLALCSLVWPDRRRLVATLASGFLVDLDHFLDYFWARAGHRGRIILPLHAWEWLPIVALVDRMLGLRGALTAGYAVHLTMDQIWNEKRSPLAYFALFRASRGFRADQLGPLDPEKRHVWRQSSLAGLARWF